VNSSIEGLPVTKAGSLSPRTSNQLARNVLVRPVPAVAYCNCGDTPGVVPGTGWFGYRRSGLVFDGGQVCRPGG
jgi:hypothetical protein